MHQMHAHHLISLPCWLHLHRNAIMIERTVDTATHESQDPPSRERNSCDHADGDDNTAASPSDHTQTDSVAQTPPRSTCADTDKTRRLRKCFHSVENATLILGITMFIFASISYVAQINSNSIASTAYREQLWKDCRDRSVGPQLILTAGLVGTY